MAAIDITGDGGVLKEILVPGTGEETPKKNDEVYVHYVGTLASDGSKFDSSRDRADPFHFKLGTGSVIKGWDIGVATMRRGEKAMFTLRSDYAYGAQGSGEKIPGGATLKFEVELLRWNEKDIAGTNGGVTYKSISEGSGWQHPEPHDEVKVKFTASRLPSRQVLESTTESTLVKLGTRRLPSGVELAITKEMKQGMKATITCSPTYSVGFGGDDSVEYELELEDWNTFNDATGDGGVTVKCLGQVKSYEKGEDAATVEIELEGRVVNGLGEVNVFEPKHSLSFRVGDGKAPECLEVGLNFVKSGQHAEITVLASHVDSSLGLPQGSSVVYNVFLKSVKQPYQLSVNEKVEAAARRREIGNDQFKAGHFDKALKKYDAAFKLIEFVNDDEHTDKAAIDQAKLLCHLNRAMVHKKTNNHKSCIKECDEALKLDEANTKALFRRGGAHLDLGELDLARKDLQHVLEIDPSSKDAEKLIAAVNQKQKQQDQKDKKVFAKMLQALGAEDDTKTKVSPQAEK
eukprot:c4624_g1_i1.p1 GENE.c4624_g1_i1~~c4624_g1_i1.p1  ORF type:complete len:517 (-),score=111.62 c4624_g1_i1:849-2399(-)